MRKRGEESPILPWDKKEMSAEFGGLEEASRSNIRRRHPKIQILNLTLQWGLQAALTFSFLSFSPYNRENSGHLWYFTETWQE